MKTDCTKIHRTDESKIAAAINGRKKSLAEMLRDPSGATGCRRSACAREPRNACEAGDMFVSKISRRDFVAQAWQQVAAR
jgi:hypothetical protein